MPTDQEIFDSAPFQAMIIALGEFAVKAGRLEEMKEHLVAEGKRLRENGDFEMRDAAPFVTRIGELL